MWNFAHNQPRASLVAAALLSLLVPVRSQAAIDRLDAVGADLPRSAAAESLWIRINVPAYRLDVLRGSHILESYPIAVGTPWTPTPRGSFRVLQKAKDPTWAPRGRKPVPPGPANPLGHRWMRISPDGYGIHATNDPASIGHARSHGCIRMSRPDAEALFDLVSLGTRVEIIYTTEGFDKDGHPTRYPDLYGLLPGEREAGGLRTATTS